MGGSARARAPTPQIPKARSTDDLLTYVVAWTRGDAVISFVGTGRYKGGAHVFWLNPFVDGSNETLNCIAGGPPTYSACLDAAGIYAFNKIMQAGVQGGTVSAAQEARVKFPTYSPPTVGTWPRTTTTTSTHRYRSYLATWPCGDSTSP